MILLMILLKLKRGPSLFQKTVTTNAILNPSRIKGLWQNFLIKKHKTNKLRAGISNILAANKPVYIDES